MKKITLFIFIIIVFNFIYSSFFNIKVYATTEESSSSMMTMEDYKLLDEGKATVNGEEMTIDVSDSDTGSAASQFATLITSISAVFSRLMTDITSEGGFYYTDSDFSAEKTGFFTINSLVFGEYVIFSTKAYQKTSDLNPNITPSFINNVFDDIKDVGAGFSKVISTIALSLSVPLILLAIARTVMARNAEDLATWKKILVRWVLCIALIFFYKYILAAIDVIADGFIDGFWNIRKSLENSGYNSFEVTIEESLINSLKNTGGVTSLGYSIEFVLIIILQIMFLFKYVARSLVILMLFIVAPLIVLIHSFNLMMGKANNILGTFFQVYIFMEFMQPIHAFFYIIFFFSLSEIAIIAPVLGIFLLFAIYRAENIIKAITGFELGSSILSMAGK